MTTSVTKNLIVLFPQLSLRKNTQFPLHFPSKLLAKTAKTMVSAKHGSISSLSYWWLCSHAVWIQCLLTKSIRFFLRSYFWVHPIWKRCLSLVKIKMIGRETTNQFSSKYLFLQIADLSWTYHQLTFTNQTEFAHNSTIDDVPSYNFQWLKAIPTCSDDFPIFRGQFLRRLRRSPWPSSPVLYWTPGSKAGGQGPAQHGECLPLVIVVPSHIPCCFFSNLLGV